MEEITKKNVKDLKFYYKRQLEQELIGSKTFFINNDQNSIDKFLLGFS